LLGTHTQLPIGVDARNLLGVSLLQHCGCESHLWKDESDVTVHVVFMSSPICILCEATWPVVKNVK